MKISIITAVIAALFIWLTGEQMPASVASHFDAAGHADSYLSRDSYIMLMISIVIVISLVTGLLSRFIPSLSDELINLPNKSYWLAPERRAESLNYIANWLVWCSVGMALFLCYVHWLVVVANNAESKQLNSALVLLGVAALLVATTVGLVKLVLRFRGAPVDR